LEKRERGRIQGLSNLFGYPAPIISGTAKAAIFKFCTHIYRLDRNKSPLKISRKVAWLFRDSRNFAGHPYIRRISRGHCGSSAFLFTARWRCTFVQVCTKVHRAVKTKKPRFWTFEIFLRFFISFKNLGFFPALIEIYADLNPQCYRSSVLTTHTSQTIQNRWSYSQTPL